MIPALYRISGSHRGFLASCGVLVLIAIFAFWYGNQPRDDRFTWDTPTVTTVVWGTHNQPVIYDVDHEFGKETLFVSKLEPLLKVGRNEVWSGLFRIEDKVVYRHVGRRNSIFDDFTMTWEIAQLPEDAKYLLLIGRIKVDAHLHPEKLRKA